MYFSQTSSNRSFETVILFIDEAIKTGSVEYKSFLSELVSDAHCILSGTDYSTLKSRSIETASLIALKHRDFIGELDPNNISIDNMKKLKSLLEEDMIEPTT